MLAVQMLRLLQPRGTYSARYDMLQFLVPFLLGFHHVDLTRKPSAGRHGWLVNLGLEKSRSVTCEMLSVAELLSVCQVDCLWAKNITSVTWYKLGQNISKWVPRPAISYNQDLQEAWCAICSVPCYSVAIRSGFQEDHGAKHTGEGEQGYYPYPLHP